MSVTSTHSLLDRLWHHDPEGWERVVELYGPLVFAWSRRHGLNAHDAADIVQEVFTAVARSVHRYQTGQGTFRAWLWTIARNKIHDHYRRQPPSVIGGSTAWQRLQQFPDPWRDDASGDSRTETSQLAHRCLATIRRDFGEKTWQAFWRTVVMSEPTDVVAADLQISENAVRQYKSRVLRHLRRELGDQIG